MKVISSLKSNYLTKLKDLQEKVNLLRLVKMGSEAKYQHFVELNKKYETRKLEFFQNNLKLDLERGDVPGLPQLILDPCPDYSVCAGLGFEVGLLVKKKTVC